MNLSDSQQQQHSLSPVRVSSEQPIGPGSSQNPFYKVTSSIVDQEVDIRQSYASPVQPQTFTFQSQDETRQSLAPNIRLTHSTANFHEQESLSAGKMPNSPSQTHAQDSSINIQSFEQQSEIGAQVDKCSSHGDQFILFCLKDQERVCGRCLNSTHLLHPVVPLNSLDQLDFHKSIQQEVEGSINEIKGRQQPLRRFICDNIEKHKIELRSHIIEIRDHLRDAFDDFFNNLLFTIRKDWNLFNVQEVLVKQTQSFNTLVVQSLSQITQSKTLAEIKTKKKQQEEELRKFYQQLSEAQVQVQAFKEDWKDYENTMHELMGCLKDHSEFDVIENQQLKGFLAENFVMNFSNIDLNKITIYKKSELNNQLQRSQNQVSPRTNPNGRISQAQSRSNNSEFGLAVQQQQSLQRPLSSSQLHSGFNRQRSDNQSQSQSQLVGVYNQQSRPQTAAIDRSEMRSTNQNLMQSELAVHGAGNSNNRIHFFKFDQKIITYYDVDNDRKTREQLLQEFTIPIRFCSIQTNDGKIFITGGAKNSSQSSNHAYELRDNTLVQLPNMINPREGHCLAAIGSSYIYAIGSRLYNTSKTCEVYSIQRNQWREQPDLNRNRYLSTAVTIADRYIYVLGGYEPSVTDIERLDTESGDQPYWELIKVWSQSFENDIKYWFGACPISNKEILIFGGKKEGNSSASSYLFDTQLNQISKTGNMPQKDTFYQRTFLCRNNKVYAYGYENENAYIYNTLTGQWTKK